MLFETLEDNIIARLNSKIASGTVEIEVMPDVEKDFVRPTTKGRITVCYKESDYNPLLSTGPVIQKETQQIELYLQATKRRGLYGIYDLFNKSRLALVGFTPDNCDTKIQGVKFDFWLRENNMWIYRFLISTTSRLVEDYEKDEDEIGGGLQSTEGEEV
jgi:hypothetical protein